MGVQATHMLAFVARGDREAAAVVAYRRCAALSMFDGIAIRETFAAVGQDTRVREELRVTMQPIELRAAGIADAAWQTSDRTRNSW